jgi:hypothetical protein
LAHSSEYKSSNNFSGYPKADEYKHQTSHQKRSLIATSTREKKSKDTQKGRVLKHHFLRKRNMIMRMRKVKQKWFTLILMIIMKYLDEMIEAKYRENFEELEQEPLEGDFVLVQFDIQGRRHIFYIGEVMCFKNDGNDYEVNFLRRSNSWGDKFIKPEIEDRASIHEKQIKFIIPKP